MTPKNKILTNPIYIETHINTLIKARALRNKMTESERVLWDKLRLRKLNGLKFRRQHPICHFIVDFYCHEKKLVIEIDGGYHLNKEQKEYDEDRSFELQKMGIRVLRFTNEEVLNNLCDVLKRIEVYIGNISAQ